MACQVCGKPSGFYPLCPACFRLKDEGKIVKCAKCEKWHRVDEACDCRPKRSAWVAPPPLDNNAPLWRSRQPIHQKDEGRNTGWSAEATAPKVEVKNSKDERSVSEINATKCLICGKESHGQWFCPSCYHEFKAKVLHLKVKNCTEVEILDDSYEGVYTCIDGHIVKSKSERDIDNYLFYHNIFHAYEKALPIDGNAEHDLHPDFYLPKENLYIEHWGYDESNYKYSEIKKYKIEQYKKLGITLICTHEKTDAKDINTALDRKLLAYKKGEINFDE